MIPEQVKHKFTTAQRGAESAIDIQEETEGGSITHNQWRTPIRRWWVGPTTAGHGRRWYGYLDSWNRDMTRVAGGN